MPLTIVQLYKFLPKTNCGDCGQPACMAFAARVIAEGEDFGKCPHLSPEAQQLTSQLREQQKAQGKRPDSLAIALEYLQEKVAPLDFSSLASGLGAEYGEEDGRPFLRLLYFTWELQVFKGEVRYSAGVDVSPWNAILLYNYIASRGNKPIKGEWITFSSLPNSVSKAKTLDVLEQKLAGYFSGQLDFLWKRIDDAGGRSTDAEGNATIKALFRPLPRIPVLMLFWDDTGEEHFGAQCHFLFDAHVMSYLDIESLLFLVEQLVDHLLPGETIIK